MVLISALGKQRQAELCEFEIILVYRVLRQPRVHRKPCLRVEERLLLSRYGGTCLYLIVLAFERPRQDYHEFETSVATYPVSKIKQMGQ